MNEKIKQLAEQAGNEIKAEYEDEIRRNRRLYNEIFLPKFAELIVKECTDIANGTRYDGKVVANRIKFVFGVEE